MIEELYDNIDDSDDEMDFYDSAEYVGDEDEIDDMLEALMESEDEDLSEKRRRRRGRSSRKNRKPVSTAQGKSAYRAPPVKKYVTHPELKNALTLVGKDIQRNAMGIKTVNKRVEVVNTRVDGLVKVDQVQSKNIGKLNQQMKLDGALEFAASVTTNADGTLGLHLLPLLRGAIKSGMLGSSKGAFSSPAVIGGLGFLLNNPQIIGGLLSGTGALVSRN